MDRPDKPIHGVSSPSKRRHHGCGLDLRVVTIVVPGSSHTTLDLLSGMMPPPSIRSQRPSTTLIRHRRKPPPLIHCPRMPRPLIHSQRPSTASIHRRRMPPLSIHHPGIPLPSICGWRIGTPGIRHWGTCPTYIRHRGAPQAPSHRGSRRPSPPCTGSHEAAGSRSRQGCELSGCAASREPHITIPRGLCAATLGPCVSAAMEEKGTERTKGGRKDGGECTREGRGSEAITW